MKEFYTRPKVECTPPLTDKQKEELFDVRIEYLTLDEIKEKYGEELANKVRVRLNVKEKKTTT